MVAEFVFVTAWQLQCCGEPFQTGSVVEWTTSSADDEYLTSFLPHDVADRVTCWEEHHADPDVQLDVVRGTVESIDAVFCTLERLPGAGGLTPLPGSGVLDHREAADGWEEEDQLHFCGYLVAVNPERS